MKILSRSKSSPAVAAAFTLMELMVSIAILVLVILSIGVVFQGASRSVGVSQSVLGMLSDVRAVQLQINHDIAGIDKNGFLVIRSRKDVSGRRYDQISFLANGNFPNRTGVNNFTNPFTDPLSANSALIWYGQLAIQANPVPAAGNYLAAAQGTQVALSALPSGVNESDFILGRSAILLVPPSGNALPTYNAAGSNYRVFNNCQFSAPNVTAFTSNESASNITCSRIDIASGTSGNVIQSVADYLQANGRAGHETYEADNYCYRHACLRSPYESETGATAAPASLIVNGFYRMSPILLQGVSSLAIEWSDGTPDPTNGLKWYGLTDAAVAVVPKADTDIEPASPSNGDGYQAIFSVDHRTKWPTALRFRYHVADAAGRLPGGRDFVEIVNLP